MRCAYYAIAISLLAPAGSADAAGALPLQGEVINGVAIAPGVERLSYISPRYYGIRPSYDACITATQGQVALQGDCADAEFPYQDARLNRAYNALLAYTDAIESADLRAAQRAWLTFSKKDCAVRAARFGSNAGPGTQVICRMESTAMRAQTLEDWLSTTRRNR